MKIPENIPEKRFEIYPNPIHEYFIIHQSSSEPYDLTLYNNLGQKLIEEKKITEINKTINTLLFQNGFLFINIRTKNQSVNYKIIKS